VSRLVSSLRDAGVPAGSNVWAELGSTWFLVLRRPTEAAHVLGKLLLAVGEDRILWGTAGVDGAGEGRPGRPPRLAPGEQAPGRAAQEEIHRFVVERQR
jgi:hypothetical protein